MLLVRYQHNDQHIERLLTHADRLEVNISSGDLKKISEKSGNEGKAYLKRCAENTELYKGHLNGGKRSNGGSSSWLSICIIIRALPFRVIRFERQFILVLSPCLSSALS